MEGNSVNPYNSARVVLYSRWSDYRFLTIPPWNQSLI